MCFRQFFFFQSCHRHVVCYASCITYANCELWLWRLMIYSLRHHKILCHSSLSSSSRHFFFRSSRICVTFNQFVTSSRWNFAELKLYYISNVSFTFFGQSDRKTNKYENRKMSFKHLGVDEKIYRQATYTKPKYLHVNHGRDKQPNGCWCTMYLHTRK